MQYIAWSFKNFLGFASTIRHIPLNMGSKVKKIMKWKLKLWILCILFEINFFVLFRNDLFQNVISTFTSFVKLDVENGNVVSTLPNVVHINVEIDSVDSTLSKVVNSHVEIQNVVSMLIWRCSKSRRRINQKTTLKQRSKDCWEGSYCYFCNYLLEYLQMTAFSVPATC